MLTRKQKKAIESITEFVNNTLRSSERLKGVSEQDLVDLFKILVECRYWNIDRLEPDANVKYHPAQYGTLINLHKMTPKNSRQIHSLRIQKDFQEPPTCHKELLKRLANRFSSLECIAINTYNYGQSLPTLLGLPELLETISVIPNLKEFDADFDLSDSTTIQENSFCFPKLERLILRTFDVTRILTEVLPFFPNLRFLKIQNYKVYYTPICSVAKGIIEHNKKNDASSWHTQSSRLRELNITVCGKNSTTKEIIDAMSTILLAFPELSKVDNFSKIASTRIDALMAINHAGRVLVEGRKNPDGTRLENYKIPLSIWPRVLERTSTFRYGENGFCRPLPGSTMPPHGLYYLLRNTPVLYDVSRRRETMGSTIDSKRPRKRAKN